jgi:aminoglycoside phosphotransferase (APT) family kinase protein
VGTDAVRPSSAVRAPHIVGIDAQRVGAWLEERTHVVQPLRFSPISGGRSNLTVRIEDAAGHAWVLRRPPTVGVLPSAHDVAREHRIIEALRTHRVPVPRAVGLCTDDQVTGAPFYVMDAVEGLVVRDGDDARSLAVDTRRRVSGSLIDTLAQLHAIDPAATSLADLGRRDAYLERQLRRLHRQYRSSAGRTLPLVDELRDRLRAQLPRQQRASIVHGDYRLDNVMISPEGDVRAVLDWELCTLGDPLADLALLHVYWLEPGDEVIPSLSSPTDLPGFATRAELNAHYASLTGLDLSDLSTYVAFGFWKLAIILEGVHTRYRSGAYVDDDEAYERLGGAVPRLLERSHETLTAR